MENFDYFILQTAEEEFNLKPKILEIGSRIQENQSHLAIRQIFGNKNNKDEYIGIDFIEGPGVDMVENVQNLPLADNYFNTIIALNLLEHVEQFWLAVDEIKRLIAQTGIIILSTPFIFEIHGCPHDYYRFTPDYYRGVFKEFNYVIVGWIGDEKMPKNVFCLASDNPLIKNKYESFYKNLERKYLDDIRLTEYIKFKLRSFVCGNRFKNVFRHFHSLTCDLKENH